MSYQLKKIRAGNILVIKKYHCFKCPAPGTKRCKKKDITPEAKRKLNISDAVDRLYYRLCANFTENDLYITLKYDGEVNKAIACEQMKEDVRKFIRILRTEYKKQGKVLKYALAFGISGNKVRHAHMVVKKINQKLISSSWRKATSHAGRITFEYLWSGYDYKGLAEYFVKNGISAVEYAPEVFHHFFECSRNMDKPVITVTTIESTKTFRKKPKSDSDYEIIEVKEGCDFYGYPYIKYIMRKKL